jgi:methyl-accepting chemotaxis protein
MNLLGKILSRVVLLIIVVSVAIGGIAYYKASKSTNELMMNSVVQQLKLNSELINEKLSSSARMMEVLSYGSTISTDLRLGLKNPSTTETFTTIVNENSELLSLVSLVDSKGIIINTDDSNVSIIGADLSARPYLIEAIEKGETVISDVIISKATGKSVVAIATPIYTNDKYKGAVIATIDFATFSDVISKIKIAENGYAYMLDISGKNAGVVVAHINPTLVEEEQNIYDLNIPGLSALVDDAKANNTGSSEYKYKGSSKFAEFQNVGNWMLVITADKADLTKTATDIRNITIIVIIISIVVASVISYFLVKFVIMIPLKKLESSMEAAGEGDLTNLVDIKTKDELENLGNSFNRMIENQRVTLTSINTISSDLTASAEELTASASDVNDSAEDVSKNIEEMMVNTLKTSSQLNEVKEEVSILNTSIENSHELSSKSHASCKVAVEFAYEGRESLVESVESIENISGSTDQIIGNFVDLNEHAKEVTGISETIKGIAAQINLLALNASIEAARAGDAGKGFTVVAEEVRKLAVQTSNESQSISGVLTTITNLINDADECVNITKKQVDIGETSIKSLDGKLLEIVETFKALDVDILELDKIASNQVEISDKITGYVNDVSVSAEMNSEKAQGISAAAEEQSAITESLSAASEETSSMADDLNRMIDKFKL